MNNNEYFIYLLIMVLTTYLLRVVPLLLIKGKIKNEFINSALYYIPYTVLTTMTFPAALYVTDHIASAFVGLAFAIICAIKIKNLTVVALISCIAVLLTEIIFF